MKKQGLAGHLKSLVSFDIPTDQMVKAGSEVGIQIYPYEQVIEAGKNEKSAPAFKKCTENDYPLFSYTSGTTGDSKGVKLTHKNILSGGTSIIKHTADLTNEDALMSYLPYPHSFE